MLRWSSIVLLVAFAACAPAHDRPRDSAVAHVTAPDDYLIDTTGIGPLHLDQTLDEARRVAPKASFTRSSDGDGAILVNVELAPDTTIVVYANETGADIEWSKRIESIETFKPAFHTADGIRVGSLIVDVEKILGPVSEIIQSEIEQREYVTFRNQPRRLQFRLDYTGVFAEGSRQTTRYSPGARIFSIAVNRYR